MPWPPSCIRSLFFDLVCVWFASINDLVGAGLADLLDGSSPALLCLAILQGELWCRVVVLLEFGETDFLIICAPSFL